LSKKRDDSYFAADRRRKKKYMMIIVPVIVAVAAAGAAGAFLYQAPQAAAISGVECHRGEFNNYHVHSHLDVFVDGQKEQVPDNVGILSSPSCLYWLHTHSGAEGVIHVEAPETRDFTLGQFLDIWKQTRDSAGLFESVAGMNATAYVDGNQFEGNYRDVKLDSLREIALVYGEPPKDIPADFDFEAEGITS
jgi:hypothetical protein